MTPEQVQFPMTPEQKKFLDDIALELKTQPGFNEVEQLFFPLRFNKNIPTLYKHKYIAEKMMRPEASNLPIDFYSKSIGTTMQNIISAMVGRSAKKYLPRTAANKETNKPSIKGLYEADMRADGIDIDSLLTTKPGEKGSWEVVYHWLWNHKYLRWLEENGWDILQKKAKSPSNWLQFLEMSALQAGTKAPSLRLPAKIKPTIPANEELWMAIYIEFTNYQLLLFNRSKQGKLLLCSSFGYAENATIEKSPFLLPKSDSLAGKTEQKFIFKEMGEEEFLAIALEKPLSLPWLIPSEEEPLPEWNAKRMKELFDCMEKQNNWQIFYQSFEVVGK